LGKQNYKNLRIKFTKILEQKFQKFRNKIKKSRIKNLGTKISKNQEQKFQKCGNKSYKNSGTKIVKIWE
jgi:hypothetical protein